MSHDPIHNWLDMAFRTLGGEKGAYQGYKQNQERERRQREEEQERRQTRRSEPDIPFDRMATMAGGFPHGPTFYGSIGGTGGPLSSGGTRSKGPSGSGSSNSHGPPGGPYTPEDNGSNRGSGHYGSHSGSLSSRNRAHSGSPASPYSVSQASSRRRSSSYPQTQRPITDSRSLTSSSARQSNVSAPQNLQGLRIGSLHGVSIPHQQRGGDSASRTASRSDVTNNAQRIPTYQSPLGDMTRSYLEGMVPNSEADSFKRRWRSGR
jgi:hypothetical protein